jgi:uncharacterized caspase-like protein
MAVIWFAFRASLIMLWGVGSLFLSVCVAGPAVAKRVALVVANGDYHQTKKLPNPMHDATLMVSKLEQLGFNVRFERNVDAKQFSTALVEFSSTLDKDTDAFFYYAGHGLQYKGENYLVGIDAALKDEATLPFETFRLETVLALLESKASTSIIFWDACRNNPLADQLLRSISIAVPDQTSVRGLPALIPPRRGNTLIVFSAEPGKYALDGKGDFSPFAEALGRHLPDPNIEVEQMLKRVTNDVIESTKNFQLPQRLSQLTNEFYFNREMTAEKAYKEERDRVNAKVDRIERQPVLPKHFTIIGTSQSPNSKTLLVRPEKPQVTTRDASQSGPLELVVAVNLTESTIVRKMRFSPNGHLVALGGDDGVVRIVSLDTFEVTRVVHAHTSQISDLDFSPDSTILLSAGRDGAVRFWNVSTGERAMNDLSIKKYVPYSARINLTNPNRFILMGDRDGHLVAWDLQHAARVITDQTFHKGPVRSVGYQQGGAGTFLSGGADGSIKVRLPDGKRTSVHAHNGGVFQAGYSPSGSMIYSVGADHKIKLWNSKLARLNPDAVLEGHLKYVLAADISPDQTLLVSGGGDKVLNLWDLRSKELIGRMKGHTADVESVDFTANGKFIISTSEDRSLRIWSAENREELARIFFKKDSGKFAGITADDQLFGDFDSEILAFYNEGRLLTEKEYNEMVAYIGRGIAIIETQD